MFKWLKKELTPEVHKIPSCMNCKWIKIYEDLCICKRSGCSISFERSNDYAGSCKKLGIYFEQRNSENYGTQTNTCPPK